MTKLNFLHKMFWLVAVLSAAAVVFNSCNGNGDEPTPPTIAGTYVGTMTVEVLFPPPGGEEIFENQNIIITDEAGGLVGLNILNFAFNDYIELGNLEVTGISTTHVGDTTTLSKDGESDGPIIEFLGDLGTTIKLNSASVTSDGVLTLDIGVILLYDTGMEIFPLPVANVTFTGNISE